MAEYDTVAIVGVGLIGGSIGLALRERGLAREIVGIGRDRSSLREKRRTGVERAETTLEAALRLGVIDRATGDLAAGVSNANVVVVCTPVDSVAKFAIAAANACPQHALVTDAGSTKETIVSAVEAGLTGHRAGPRFVGSHPIAGDHRGGPEHARADLFEGRTVVVTPTTATRPAAVTEASGFWQNLGAKVMTMSPAEHDKALAATSHLPHLVAAALAAATPVELLRLTAGGWGDTTRVAGGDPALWAPIFESNQQNVLEALERFNSVLANICESLEQGDWEGFREALEAAAARKGQRDALGD